MSDLSKVTLLVRSHLSASRAVFTTYKEAELSINVKIELELSQDCIKFRHQAEQER